MRRTALAVFVLFGTSCAALAGVDDYRAVDCIAPQCEDAGAAESGLPVADTMLVDTMLDDAPNTETLDAGDAPGCAPIAASSVAIGTWSIDATEVTNAQYAAFLAARGSDTSGQPGYCSWNTTFVPTAGWPAPTDHCNHPVVRVDWCDAWAYCKWAGKRLCGSPSGGPTPYADNAFETASTSQWFAACSRGVASRWIYGATYVAGACVDNGFDGKAGGDVTDVRRRVASAPTCRGTSAPYDRLYDVNGNVAEWEDSCNDVEDGSDDCRTRGGSYLDAWDHSDCHESRQLKRSQTADTVGIRCCSL